MKTYFSPIFLATLLIVCVAVVVAVEQQDHQHQGERRMQGLDSLGDIFNGFFGDGFFLCNDGVEESVEFYIYFLYLAGSLFFGGDSGEFLGKIPGKCGE